MSEPHIPSFDGSAFDRVFVYMCTSVCLSGLNSMGIRIEHVVVMIVLIAHAQFRTHAHVCMWRHDGGQERAGVTWSHETERARMWA